jgi:hypothetical protein
MSRPGSDPIKTCLEDQRRNQDKKFIVTIAWNPLGFYSVMALTAFLPEAGGRKLILHAENARPHPAENRALFVHRMGCDWRHTRHASLSVIERLCSSVFPRDR